MNIDKDKQSNLNSVFKIHNLTKVHTTQIEYVWKIENFSFCFKKYEILESALFPSNNSDVELKWCLRIYTKGVSPELNDYIGLFLVLVEDQSKNRDKPKQVVYDCCILDKNNQKVNLVKSQPDGREFCENESWGFPKFIKKESIQNENNMLISNNELTILLKMCIFGDIVNQNLEESIPKKKEVEYKKIKKTYFYDNDPKTMLKKRSLDLVENFVLISSDGEKIPVHQIILANQSSVFMHKFESYDKDYKRHLELKNYDSQTIKDALGFIYSERTDFKSDLVNLLNFSDTYSLKDLKNYCEKLMINKITINNAAEYLVAANKCNATILKKYLWEFIRKNISSVMESDSWKKISEIYPKIVADTYKTLINEPK